MKADVKIRALPYPSYPRGVSTVRQAFMTFADTADAVAASTEMIDSKMGKSLKKFLTKNIVKKELKDKVCGGTAVSAMAYHTRD